jgi:NAD(P)-dependent dehydrogenase (short-subunit alcohol dehydrogenase family)
MNPYEGSRAVIVGGTTGIGLATAEALVAGGATVLVTGRNERNLAAARGRLGSGGVVLASDASSLEAIDELGRQVEAQFGEIDLAFLNAGVASLEPVAEISPRSYDHIFDVNAKGVFLTAQRLAPLVREGGSLVFTTVTDGTATPAMGVYMASKAAVRAFARVLAAELLPRRIRVNTVAPGFIDTPTLGVAGMTAEERAAFHRVGDEVVPMRRHGSPEEVARAVLFLAFDATYTTGAELPVDGGLAQLDRPA